MPDRTEVAVEALGKSKDSIAATIRNELLGVTTDKPPHKRVAGRKSVVFDFNLAREANAPRFDIAVKQRVDELKPSRPYPPGSPVIPEVSNGKYYLADVTLEIPLSKPPEKSAEPAKDGGKKE